MHHADSFFMTYFRTRFFDLSVLANSVKSDRVALRRPFRPDSSSFRFPIPRPKTDSFFESDRVVIRKNMIELDAPHPF